MRGYHGWHVFWLVWFLVSFCTFLAVEIYALVTDYRRTLSEAIWAMEDFKPGQSVMHWSALHFLFGGVLLLTFVWLTGHFLFHIWH